MNRLPTREYIQQLTSGATTARQLTQSCLDRIATHNGALNAFISVDADGALQQADDIDRRRRAGESVGRLAGLPIGIKDNMCQKGRPTTCGSRMLQNFRPPYDAHVVERLRAADGVILGKLNPDEFAMGSSTETSLFGPTRNPWDQTRSAGGSSGGSAVAVAAGFVPLALGSDTGGSIRQPASFCGVVGLKPTYGRVSRYGLIAYASSLDQIGPLANDVYGATLLLESIAGHDKRDSTSLDLAAPTWTTTLDEPLKGLRIGIADEYFAEGLDAEVERCVREALKVFESAGATVHTVSLPHSRYAVATYYLIACSEASSNLARFDGIHYGHRAEKFDDLVDLYCQSRSEGFGVEVKRRIMLGTYALSKGYYDDYYLKALKVRRRIADDFAAAFKTVDVIAGPVAPTPAFRLGEKLDDPLAMYLGDIYTISTNLAGLPGISVPCGLTMNRLPIGMQLQASALDEARLLQVAHQLQQLTKWHLETPEM
ncbi:MAG: Asp-tRNA(Asn)/Glu-tRNA(Gln) amidotransferase subunit GatA [Planctomycetota bacterium]|nr:Asp-tRNA(Asn)/Glu-tRNA(Gln) amidotransferase subunit GatA [Planctomycetota bacterium]